MSKKKKKDSDLPETQPEGLDPRDVRIKELEEANAILADQALVAEARAKSLAVYLPLVDPDQVETHHLNPGELPPWVLAKLPESLTVDTSKFQEPNVAYAIRFAIGRGAKEGDIVHFCAGV